MNERARLAELAKRRGFFFPANESYGGTAGFYVYGPQGASIKTNVEEAWRDRFAVRQGHMEITSPTVMPEAVFEASGHLDGFDDMLIECAECEASHRADHLVEDATDITDAESLTPTEVSDLIAEHEIQCPSCGALLADQPVENFNLMFGTNIGPGSSAPGYLRPETAQGIFVEFPRLKEYARSQLPFGVTQIGPAYRNEISPRRGLIRLREFTQAELELFIDPERNSPPIDRVADVELPLYSAQAQQTNGDVTKLTVADAVEEGVIMDAWIGYYLVLAIEWYREIGVDLERFRYRQHLTGERAHYAADCWDAESEVAGDWIEITGFAYRSDYDLSKHAAYSEEDYTLFRQYEEPQTLERARVDPDMSYLGPEFGESAEAIADSLASLAADQPSAFEDETVEIELDGETVSIPVAKTGFSVEIESVAGEHITPHVVEPSFGIDRLVYTVLAHNVQEDEVGGESRTVLKLPPAVAPTTVGVFPLMDQDGLAERAREIAESLRAAGLSVTYDDSGSIGRRYRRQDEVGTPFCVTIDYDTLEDDTATIRDRDSARQRRVPTANLSQMLAEIRDGTTTFDQIGTEVADTP